MLSLSERLFLIKHSSLGQVDTINVVSIVTVTILIFLLFDVTLTLTTTRMWPVKAPQGTVGRGSASWTGAGISQPRHPLPVLAVNCHPLPVLAVNCHPLPVLAVILTSLSRRLGVVEGCLAQERAASRELRDSLEGERRLGRETLERLARERREREELEQRLEERAREVREIR